MNRQGLVNVMGSYHVSSVRIPSYLATWAKANNLKLSQVLKEALEIKARNSRDSDIAEIINETEAKDEFHLSTLGLDFAQSFKTSDSFIYMTLGDHCYRIIDEALKDGTKISDEKLLDYLAVKVRVLRQKLVISNETAEKLVALVFERAKRRRAQIELEATALENIGKGEEKSSSTP
jgi:hypothetical protein